MDYNQTLLRWIELTQTIKHLSAEEKALREGLFAGTFPDPVEGTNTFVLPDGSKLKGTYKFNRKVDQVLVLKLPKPILKAAFKVEYGLKLKEYRALEEDQIKLIDNILTVTPGLPSLEFVPAKLEVPE